MKLTQALKAYLVTHLGLKETDSEATMKKSLALAIAGEKITTAKVRELLAVPDAAPAAQPAAAPAPVRPQRSAPPMGVPPRPQPSFQDAVQAAVAREIARLGVAPADTAAKGVSAQAVLSKAAPVQARVKSAAESYSNHRKEAFYPAKTGRRQDGGNHLLAGQRVEHDGVPLDHPGDLDKAVSAAYWKWCVKSSPLGADQNSLPQWMRLTDHDADLVNWALRNYAWSGLIKGQCRDEGATEVKRRKLADFEVKALLDDSTSGGIEAAPIVFDDAIVLVPVLYGELFPLVNVQNVAKGRRMKGAAMSNPTFTSGTAEGTAIGLFDTTSFVSAFDTTIYPAVAAIEIGLDFEEDSPVDMGGQIVEQYGLKALEWLDRVIAVGDGTTEPQGIFNASGTVSVSAARGPGGPLAVSDFEGLMFGVSKAYRNEAGSTPVYVSNDTMYRRAVGIAVGPADERRVFGMEHGDYKILGRPYKVQNSIGSGKLAYFNPKRYRMYRRLGLQVRMENSGYTLARNNTRLIVLRMRYGGQIENGAACAIMTDAHV